MVEGLTSELGSLVHNVDLPRCGSDGESLGLSVPKGYPTSAPKILLKRAARAFERVLMISPLHSRRAYFAEGGVVAVRVVPAFEALKQIDRRLGGALSAPASDHLTPEGREAVGYGIVE